MNWLMRYFSGRISSCGWSHAHGDRSLPPGTPTVEITGGSILEWAGRDGSGGGRIRVEGGRAFKPLLLEGGFLMRLVMM